MSEKTPLCRTATSTHFDHRVDENAAVLVRGIAHTNNFAKQPHGYLLAAAFTFLRIVPRSIGVLMILWYPSAISSVTGSLNHFFLSILDTDDHAVLSVFIKGTKKSTSATSSNAKRLDGIVKMVVWWWSDETSGELR